MADITPSTEFDFKLAPVFRKNIISVWSAMLLNHVGLGILASGFPDKTVQVVGTFGGCSVVIEGSNNSTDGDDGNWSVLVDPFNSSLSFTSAGLKQILENTKYVRARISGGDGTTSITVILFGSSNKDPR